MLFGGHQLRTVRLWSVFLSQDAGAGQITNGRTAAQGISGPNPRRINDNFTIAYFAIRCTQQFQYNLPGVRIYGDSGITIGGGDSNPVFPSPGATLEALCATTANIPQGAGVVRAPGMHRVDADTRRPFIVVPRFVLLEFSTGPPGIGGLLAFIVDACMIGPQMSSQE